jgi:hypothetical protein
LSPSGLPVAVANYRMATIGETPVLLCDWLDAERLAELAGFLLRLEPRLLELPRAPSWLDREGNETSARYASYNLMSLRDPLAKQLYDVVKRAYQELLVRLGRQPESMYIQCWVNIARAGESLARHSHPFPYHGHVTVQTDGGDTLYGGDLGVSVPNQVGRLTLLGAPGLVHEVPAYRGVHPRISVAFDLLPLSWVLGDRRWRRTWEERSFIPFD